MTNITKEQLESLKTGPFGNWCKLLGINFEELEKEVEKEEQRKKDQEQIRKIYEDLRKRGLVEPKKEFDLKFDDKKYCPTETMDELCEEAPEFNMTVDELKDWITKYISLENDFKKLSTLYGLNFTGTTSIYGKYNELVWTLIEKIFGTDNRDDIADFCFGNSNFDSVEDLYNELT